MSLERRKDRNPCQKIDPPPPSQSIILADFQTFTINSGIDLEYHSKYTRYMYTLCIVKILSTCTEIILTFSTKTKVKFQLLTKSKALNGLKYIWYMQTSLRIKNVLTYNIISPMVINMIGFILNPIKTHRYDIKENVNENIGLCIRRQE